MCKHMSFLIRRRAPDFLSARGQISVFSERHRTNAIKGRTNIEHEAAELGFSLGSSSDIEGTANLPVDKPLCLKLLLKFVLILWLHFVGKLWYINTWICQINIRNVMWPQWLQSPKHRNCDVTHCVLACSLSSRLIRNINLYYGSNSIVNVISV